MDDAAKKQRKDAELTVKRRKYNAEYAKRRRKKEANEIQLLKAKNKTLLDALKENLQFDEKIFKSSDGMGANLSNILRAHGVIKKVEGMK